MTTISIWMYMYVGWGNTCYSLVYSMTPTNFFPQHNLQRFTLRFYAFWLQFSARFVLESSNSSFEQLIVLLKVLLACNLPVNKSLANCMLSIVEFDEVFISDLSYNNLSDPDVMEVGGGAGVDRNSVFQAARFQALVCSVLKTFSQSSILGD